MFIDVKNVMEPQIDTSDVCFIKAKAPDTKAAQMRMIMTEHALEDWFDQINQTNTREMPADLQELYTQTAVMMCRIRRLEQDLASERRTNG